jgi:nicotinamidase/pyrazinamidase
MMEKFIADRIVTINVDVQNDFLPGGALAVTDGDQVTTPLNAINAFTRENGGTVIFTGDQHPTETPHFGPDAWPVHCVAGTEGAALSTALLVTSTDVIVDKGMGQTDGYSAFEGITRDGRTLEQIVQPIGNERVIALLGGLATDYCVLNSALDTKKVDSKEGTLTVMVMRDAIRAVNLRPDDGEKAIATMQAAGVIIIDSVDVLTGKAFELAK